MLCESAACPHTVGAATCPQFNFMFKPAKTSTSLTYHRQECKRQLRSATCFLQISKCARGIFTSIIPFPANYFLCDNIQQWKD